MYCAACEEEKGSSLFFHALRLTLLCLIIALQSIALTMYSIMYPKGGLDRYWTFYYEADPLPMGHVFSCIYILMALNALFLLILKRSKAVNQ